MITRRTFAIAVRVLAVLAAIYTFFMFRSQLAEQRAPKGRGAIPAKVISRETACGWVTVRKASTGPGVAETAWDQNAALLAAIQQPEERVAVRDHAECERLTKLNGSSIFTDKGTFEINFIATP